MTENKTVHILLVEDDDVDAEAVRRGFLKYKIANPLHRARDGMEALKEDEKKKEISEDDRKRSEDEVQKLTDKYVADTDTAVAAKVKEILTQ